jgi:hypothetical protein
MRAGSGGPLAAPAPHATVLEPLHGIHQLPDNQYT